MARWEMMESEKVGKVGERKGGSGKVGKVVELQGGKGGRFLVLFKSEGRRVSPRLHIFVSDVNQGNDGVGWVQDFLAWPQGWKESL